ncbi:Protein N-acetyltransferase, RimJ/RimL family [Microbacterium sp. cf046]|uniref:GNAT family N-acetyltransferase n=1 Tax=Microbacterium sp. cf046 TaxID=1761803 RepID=UPI0008EDBD7F|nr:GNAT family N-acetyltransferase [Microbacterium sp. cf046]SFR90179.1 Protein N-acetyltransferase, RimJ/RimL family [Microbacterium sp. cf046]
MADDERDALEVALRRWSDEDFPLLERANAPEMTRHLGGPETPEQLRERHDRYLRLGADDRARMWTVEVDGVPAGGIGWWHVDHDGVPAYETGWNVFPEWQGRGVAGAALRELIRRLAAERDRDLLIAYPGVDNAPSNALCRRAGFEYTGSGTEPWRGGQLTFNTWVLDMSPLDLAGRAADHDERFDQGTLDETRWWPYYNPHWSSRAATAARWDMREPGLTLRIDADTAPWSPEYDGENRASHLQTGQYSGPVGSPIGQHRFRDGLVVREEQPERRLWLTHFGVIEVRMRAIRHPDAMVALWPIGFEDRPEDCGEICICEIFGSELDDTGGWVGVGVKPQRDPRLTLDFEKVRVEGDLTQYHDYAVEWDEHRVRFFIDGRWVKTVAQRIDYPVQLMLDVYQLPNPSGQRDLAALPLRFDVERLRTFPPR